MCRQPGCQGARSTGTGRGSARSRSAVVQHSVRPSVKSAERASGWPITDDRSVEQNGTSRRRLARASLFVTNNASCELLRAHIGDRGGTPPHTARAARDCIHPLQVVAESGRPIPPKILGWFAPAVARRSIARIWDGRRTDRSNRSALPLAWRELPLP